MASTRRSTVSCGICGRSISRRADLARHMKTHGENKEEFMHHCPIEGCQYKTLQPSNLATHLNVHSGEKPHQCPEDECDFRTSDPGSLTRHRKSKHGYETANSRRHPSAAPRTAARRQRRAAPYTIPSSATPGASTSSSDPSLRPQLPEIVDETSPSALSPATKKPKAGIKNVRAAYRTRLITPRPQDNNSVNTPSAEAQSSFSLSSGTSSTPSEPTTESLQPPVVEEDHTVNMPPPPIPDVLSYDVTDPVLVQFLSQFGNFRTDPFHALPSIDMGISRAGNQPFFNASFDAAAWQVPGYYAY